MGEYVTCSRCDYTTCDEIAATGHNLTKTDANEPTCTAEGNNAYWTCTDCNKYFSDRSGENEIHVSSWVISAIGHSYESGICQGCGIEQSPSEGLTYTLSNDRTYYVVSGIGDCTDTDIVIPSTYDDLPVVAIGSSAFSGCESLTNVTIPNSVTSISSYAFYGCTSLTSVTIPDSVTSIGSSAFSGCESLISVTIPDSITTLEAYVFNHCSSLTSITIPDSVTSIGKAAFQSCDSLTNITIPNSVTSISSYAFNSCNFISVTIPDSVTSIGSYAFYQCHKLVEVCNLSQLTITAGYTSNGYVAAYAKNVYNFYSGHSNLTVQDGYVFYDDGGTYYLMGYIGSDTILTLPKKVNGTNYHIYGYAFDGCNSLTSVTIPDSITFIGDCAFGHCTALTSVTIPDSLTTIGRHMFVGCESLTSIAIPDLVTTIGDHAFTNCTALTNIAIPNSVTSIGAGAFSGCTSLSSVTIPDSVTYIGADAFSGCTSLTSVTIPDSVTSIGDHAFFECTSLSKVCISDLATWCNIEFADAWSNPLTYANNLYLNGDLVTELLVPNAVRYINDYAFNGCTSLTSITIPNSVTTIGISAFSECCSLTSITIPSSITTINSSAFYGCYRLLEVCNLSSLTITAGNTSNGYVAYYARNVYTAESGHSNLIEENGYIFYNTNTTYYLIRYIGKKTILTLPQDINGSRYKIHNYAFYGCTSLTSVTIPNSVTSIGDFAFYDCTSLTSVTIPDSVTYIGDYAFYVCTSLTNITFESTVDEWDTITKGMNWDDYTSNYVITCTDGGVAKDGTVMYN